MKTLLIALMMIGTAQAAEIEVQALQMSRMADDDTYQVGGWRGIQLNYVFDNEAYIFAGHEVAEIIPLWGIGRMNLTGVGGGIKHKLTDKISVFAQVGYYMISQENEGRHRMDGTHGASEGMEYYFNAKYGFTSPTYVHFDEYQIEYEDTFGGAFGVQLVQPITKNMDLGFIMSYRAMKIKETLRVMKDEWNYDTTGWCWEQGINRNYSSMNFGISLDYEF